jgi:5-methylthioadenosine/S-adenosylhomocysteine deaminase
MAIDMATRGGSDALHEPLIGTLEPGMKADFIALDLTTPNMQPVHNIVSNIVYAATGLENRLTVVDGQELYRDGKFLTCDYEALCAELQSIHGWQKQN